MDQDQQKLTQIFSDYSLFGYMYKLDRVALFVADPPTHLQSITKTSKQIMHFLNPLIFRLS